MSYNEYMERHHPMYLNVLVVIQQALLAETKWVDTETDNDKLDLWINFRERLKEINVDEIWNSIPDAAMADLWIAKSNALKTIYISLYRMFLRFTGDNISNSYVSELTQTALEYIVDYGSCVNKINGINNLDIPLLLQCENNNHEQAYDYALEIMHDRKQWMRYTNILNNIKKECTSNILTSSSIQEIDDVVERTITTLEQYFISWT